MDTGTSRVFGVNAFAGPLAKLLLTAEFFGSGFSLDGLIAAILSARHRPSFFALRSVGRIQSSKGMGG